MNDSAVKKIQDRLSSRLQELNRLVREKELAPEAGKARVTFLSSAAPAEPIKKKPITAADQLEKIADRIRAAKDLDHQFGELRDEILRLFDAEQLVLFAVDHDKKEIYCKLPDPGMAKEIEEIRLPIGEQSLVGFVAKHGKAISIADAHDKAELARINPALSIDSSWDEKNGFRTRHVLAVPVFSSFSGGKFPSGVMQLINKRNGGAPFTKEDEKLAQELAVVLGETYYRRQPPAKRKPSKFDHLIASGLIKPPELDAAVKEAVEKKRNVESILMEQYKVDKSEIGKSLTLFYGCPFVKFDGKVLIPPKLVENINLNYLRANYWIPLHRDKDKVDVLIDDPHSLQKLQDIKRVFAGRKVNCFVSLREDILKFVDSVTANSSPNGIKQSITEILNELTPAGELAVEESDQPAIDENDSAIVRLANQIIVDAYNDGASDIHIEPNSEKRETVIRFRVDGSCYEYQRVPPSYRRALCSRLKIMARLDIAERRKPQDGKIKFRLPDREIELRVATIPTAGIDNEDIVLRILSASEPFPIDKLNMSERNLRGFKEILEKPYGIILCVGPTGSGKTTTLHAALGYINETDTKIWTAEDPVEITQPGLRQVQVNPKIGFDFAAAMRAFLRADPDVIMIGEMRDKETCEIAIEASLTGHLVLSTLHTNSAVETVTRLLEVGMDPFNFADALLGVLAQRLARTLCQSCKEKYHPPKEEYDALVHAYGEQPFAKLGISYSDQFFLYRGKGCEACKHTGYKGRIGLHELLLATDAIKHLVQTRAAVPDLLKVAVGQGMTTLLQDGVMKVLQGFTDLKQVKAVAMK